MKEKKSIAHELLVVDILKTADVLTSRLSEVHKAHGITMVQYNILRILRGAHPEKMGVGEIKNRILFTKSDVSRLVDRLVVKSLVDRKICPDNRRKMNINISQSGMELLDLLDNEIYTHLDGFYEERIPLSKVEVLRNELKKIAEDHLSL